jgi:hypothetical protein
LSASLAAIIVPIKALASSVLEPASGAGPKMSPSESLAPDRAVGSVPARDAAHAATSERAVKKSSRRVRTTFS